MKIIKFKKTSKDKYIVYLDNGDYVSLFEDVIVNNNLLITKQIDESLLKKLEIQNNEQYAYNLAIKYLSTKMRSKKQVHEYLSRKNIEESIINGVISRLEKNGYINDFNFSKAYVNDALLLSNDGPFKIKNSLIKYGVKEEVINDVVNDIDIFKIKDKLSNLVKKQLKNKKGSASMIKTKLLNYFYNLGYDKEMVLKELEKHKIDFDYDNLRKEYDKLCRKYLRKYDSEQLKYVVQQKLYAKGYTKDEIDKIKKEN